MACKDNSMKSDKDWRSFSCIQITGIANCNDHGDFNQSVNQSNSDVTPLQDTSSDALPTQPR